MESRLTEERTRRIQIEADMLALREQLQHLTESRAPSKSVSFGTSPSSSNPLRSIEEDLPALTSVRKGKMAAAPNPGDDDGDDDDDGGPSRRRNDSTPYRPNPPARFPSPSGISTMSYATRIEKIPNLHPKLSDGVEYSPKLWEVQVQNALRRYANYFMDEDHKKDWLLNQTEGMARTFLEPAFIEPEFNEEGNLVDALDLVDQLVSFLSNPHDKQTARSKYSALQMESRNSFWTFYHEFRTLARTAGINDKSVLKMDLQEKLPPRLRKQLFQEYRKSRSLEEYVEAIQAEDQGQHVERTYHATSESSASVRSTSRRAIKATATFAIPQQTIARTSPLTDATAYQPRPHKWSPSPPNPARNDTPRAQTPAQTPRHYSSQPAQRSHTPYRVNEIDAGQPSDGESEGDNGEEYEDAVEEPPPPPPVKGQT